MKPTEKQIMDDYQGKPIAIVIAIVFGIASIVVAGVFLFYLILNLFIK
jgi:hypothetical protein